MKRALLAFALLPLVQSGASAQTTGSAEAGKAYWERVAPRNTDCRLCHGGMGEGGFGPDLAGRGLSTAQVLRAVRKPWALCRPSSRARSALRMPPISPPIS